MAKKYGIVLPDENLCSSVQKITFSNGAYGFYVETWAGCALVFPDGKTVYDSRFLDEQGDEAYAAEDVAYIEFRDGRIYAVDSEWEDLREVCDEWRYLEGFLTLDQSEPVFVERGEFEREFSRFQKTIFYEPRANYAAFVPKKLKKERKMSITVKLSSFVDFLYRNACDHTTTYVWCNDSGELFGDHEYYDGCHRIGFADYSDVFDDGDITPYSDNADMAKKILASALAEGDGYPTIGETDDGVDIEIVTL